MNISKNTKLNKLDHYNFVPSSTRGAMFGLDARIALAIFAALSVITGAALYKAVKQSRVIAFVAQLEEISKAVEQYYLDTGTLPPKSNATSLDSSYLFDNSANIAGWKGPYLQGASSGIALNKISSTFGNTYLKLGSIDVDWENPVSELPSTCSSKCYMWIEVIGLNSPSGIIDRNLRDSVDKYYDDIMNTKKGKIRIAEGSGGHLFLAIMPYKY